MYFASHPRNSPNLDASACQACRNHGKIFEISSCLKRCKRQDRVLRLDTGTHWKDSKLVFIRGKICGNSNFQSQGYVYSSLTPSASQRSPICSVQFVQVQNVPAKTREKARQGLRLATWLCGLKQPECLGTGLKS